MAQMDEKKLGKRIQAARRAAGLTQQVLCQKAGLSYSTLAKIERGAIRTPSIFTIQSIAAVLGTTLDELVGSPAPTVKQRHHSKSGISFVYFDVNGCLVRFYHQAFARIGADLDLPSDLVETAFWHYNDQACRGSMTMAEFNQAFSKRLGVDQFDWAAYYLQAVKPMPGMKALAEWTCAHYGVGLLTDIMPGLVRQMREASILPNIPYDTVVDSSEVHLLKPERAIYELAQLQAGCQADEILFIDDSRANLMAAEKLGWHVMWFDGDQPEQTIIRIREALDPV